MTTVSTCLRCGRPILYPLRRGSSDHGILVKVYVVHASYGCDTGCCGHIAVAEDEMGNECRGDFDFGHPDEEDDIVFAMHLASEYFPGVPFSQEDCHIVYE